MLFGKMNSEEIKGADAVSAKTPSPVISAPLSEQKPLIHLVYCVVILAVTAVTLSPVLDNGFTNWDDQLYVTENPLIRSLSIHSICRIFSPETFVCGNYQPVTIFSLAINFALGKLNPRGYLATSLFIHLLNVFLVFIFIRKLSQNYRIASVCALLFGIHPMHVESVAWVSGRKDLLYTFFYLLALLAYLRYLDKTGRERLVLYGITFVLIILSLLSKSSAITLPVALLLLYFYSGRKISAGVITEKLPLLVPAIILGVIAIIGQKTDGSLGLNAGLPIMNRVLLGSYSYMFYGIKFFAPVGLSAFYPYPASVAGALPFAFIVSPAFFVVTAGLLYYFRRSKVILFGFGFFLLNIIFILHFVPVGYTLTADRFSYLSYIGLFFILAYYLDKYLPERWPARISVYGLAAVTAAILCFVSYRRCEVWKDGVSLWSDVVSHPVNATAAVYNNLGIALMEKGRVKEAIVQYRRALEIEPEHYKAHTNLGTALSEIGLTEEAEVHLRKAVELAPDFADAHNSLGTALMKTGRSEEAVVQFRRALAIDSDYAACRYNLGTVLLQTGRPEESIVHFRKTLELNPDFVDANNDLGVALMKTGRIEEAIPWFRRAVGLDSGNADIFYNLSKAYARIGQDNDAVSCLQRATAINPSNIAMINDLCRAFLRTGQVDSAVGSARKAAALAASSGNDALAKEIGGDIEAMQRDRIQSAAASDAHPAR